MSLKFYLLLCSQSLQTESNIGVMLWSKIGGIVLGHLKAEKKVGDFLFIFFVFVFVFWCCGFFFILFFLKDKIFVKTKFAFHSCLGSWEYLFFFKTASHIRISKKCQKHSLNFKVKLNISRNCTELSRVPSRDYWIFDGKTDCLYFSDMMFPIIFQLETKESSKFICLLLFQFLREYIMYIMPVRRNRHYFRIR